MTVKRKQRCFLSILFSIAALGLFAIPSGQCNPVAVRMTPEQIRDQMTGMKFKNSLPDNFPIPKYPSNVTSTTFNYSTKGLPAATANQVTSDAKDKVFGWYQQSLRAAGWDVKVPAADTLGAKSAQFCMLKGTRPKEEVTITCISYKQRPGTSINIGWTKTP